MNFVDARPFWSSALLERDDIVSWRRRYLENIRHYRQQGRPIYYLDETWVDTREMIDQAAVDAFLNGLATGQEEPSWKSKRLIVLHIGSSDGFVAGGLLCSELERNSAGNYHEMNGDTFYEWFVRILPLLKENAIIVMDNASYHSIKKERFPGKSWKKKDITNWLGSKGEIVGRSIVKAQLLERVDLLKPRYDDDAYYVIDELAKANDKLVLRLPPYHYKLNPIDLAWSPVKHYIRMHNTTFKVEDVRRLLVKGVKRVTAEMWADFVERVIKQEDMFRNIDFVADEKPNQT
ncbi:uncharacterized protein LOC126834501 [Adelges cooleyi]|uniref:uncharacterized protein LOC126834501 n=1 Tax=Adelges cooleyi TaxID=133065 RepID=UPI00218018B0|nr:uncharacterized protein LOC126834501 [Adelges cooleyi]